METETNYVGVVQKIVDGPHGPYGIAVCEDNEDNIELGPVTFSKKVWKEDAWPPEEGHYVVLEDLSKKRGGWRAGKARLFRPEDEKKEKEEKVETQYS